jgi:hypothetical protein
MNVEQFAPQRLAALEITHETHRIDALRRRAQRRPVALPSHAGWHTSIAVRSDQIRAAEDLVCRRYAWRGLRTAPAAATPLSSTEEGSRVVLLAQNAGQLMGTLTVRRDTPQGLLAENTYADEIHGMRSEGRRLGEVVRLAIEQGADSRFALDALVQSAYIITRVIQGLTHLVIEVNPRHVRFYERVLGFVVAAAERFCERAGAPSVLLCLDLEFFGQRLQLAA